MDTKKYFQNMLSINKEIPTIWLAQKVYEKKKWSRTWYIN